MHRLLMLKCANPSNVPLLTSPRSPAIQQSSWTTSRIEIFPNFRHPRTHSTIVSLDAVKQMKSKKKKSRKKKYIELLQITEENMKETRTSVEKLKSKKLSSFIGNTNLPAITASSPVLNYTKYTLTQENASRLRLEDIPMVFVSEKLGVKKINQLPEDLLIEILESYHCFREMTGVEAPAQTEAFEEAEPAEEIEEPVEALPVQKKSKKTKKAEKVKSKYFLNPEMEQLAKQKSFMSNMITYLEMCVSTGMPNRGLATFLNYRNRWKRLNITHHYDIRLYNVLLQGFAEKGNLDKIKEIVSIIKQDSVKLIPQSFAIIIECIGRQEPNMENTKLLQKFFNEASDLEISLNDIMVKSQFLKDQREIVLNAIHRLEPDFTPSYTPPEINYKNVLLDSLNDGVRRVGETAKIPPLAQDKVEETRNLMQEQIDMEIKGYITVKSIEKFPEPSRYVLHCKTKLTELQNTWRNQIIAAFNRDLNTICAQTQCKFNSSINLFPYLKVLDTGQYADILLREIRTLAEGSETYSPSFSQLYRELGTKIQTRYHFERMKKIGLLKKTREIYLDYRTIQEADEELKDNHRQLWQRLVFKSCNEGPNMDYINQPWTPNITAAIGKFLYNILLRDVKIDPNITQMNAKFSSTNLSPAFFTLYRYQGRNLKEEIKPHPVISRLFRDAQQETLTFDTNLVPMVSPPVPWNNFYQGGYLLTKSELIRIPYQGQQQKNRIIDSPPENLYPFLDSLNQLAAVPWTVNEDVLEIALEVFNSGGSAKLDVPQPPSVLKPPQNPPDGQKLTNEQKYQIYKQKLMHKQRQAEMYSLWCDCLYRLSLANHFRNKVFWLPHNMDFRGRVYPLPPHFNHMGADLARSLLIFHEGKPLGPDGLKWLKIHCINLTGLKKRDSIDDRLKYADEVIDEILDSADNPLDGRMWWAESDEPWQTLSCCIEIAKVMRSPDPAAFVSRFPIHQDGSCNGLQHYAALGRDSAGARSVNLAPADIPQDVYSSVATLVEEARARDAARGNEVAKILEGYVKRKVIKQTVMTTVYGVTNYGARLQIARQLKDIDDFPKDFVWQASYYLTTKTFESLSAIFKSAREIQDWFTHCARLISAVRFQNVEWVTPLGLPVVQPYNHADKMKSSSKWNKVSDHFAIDMYEKPNTMKQKNAFPPNFIHSLDSSHMMLTSLHCQHAGLTFISVHDCFWTHACTVPAMNVITREQFVALHSLPILEELSDFFQKKYSFEEKDLDNDGSVADATKRRLNNILGQVPEKGDFDLKNVLKSVYFFS